MTLPAIYRSQPVWHSPCWLLAQRAKLEDQAIGREIGRRAREDPAALRLATVPGVGPATETAVLALPPGAATFSKERDFATWSELTPR